MPRDADSGLSVRSVADTCQHLKNQAKRTLDRSWLQRWQAQFIERKQAGCLGSPRVDCQAINAVRSSEIA
ncbi:MAG: hypothetical protein CBB71_21460 [Rhodopirellula sp. TMED11]|nr:MAG: hypothetical protein CBB71_21460 [Rhodopirellula sp. TMED11]